MRANYLLQSEYFLLNEACRAVSKAFDSHPILVGSVLSCKDYRDVDVRMMLPDDEFAALSPAMWKFIDHSISVLLQKQTDLPVDFQVQQMTAANSEFAGRRSSLGWSAGDQP